jgi:hypothetical protein
MKNDISDANNDFDLQHKAWLEVTSSAINEVHTTNGLKGSKAELISKTKNGEARVDEKR